MGALAWVLATAALLGVGAVAIVLRFREMHSHFDTLIADETEASLAPAEHLEYVPDGFTCLRCLENPALPSPSIWCAVCAPIVDQHPSEPIERSAR